MSERRWSKFWWQDWQRDPALRMCSLAARGAWMDLLCIAADSERKGYLLVNGRQPTMRQLASVLGVSEREAANVIRELEEAGVFSRDDDGTIYSRRMVRDAAASLKGYEDVQRRGDIKGKRDDPSSPPSRGPSSNGSSPPSLYPSSLEAEAEAEAESSLRSDSRAGRASARDAIGFATFWLAYPRKRGKDAAARAYAAALRRGATAADIAAGLARTRFNADPQFIPHPATWLNQGRWQDEPGPPPRNRDEALLRAVGLLDDEPALLGLPH